VEILYKLTEGYKITCRKCIIKLIDVIPYKNMNNDHVQRGKTSK